MLATTEGKKKEKKPPYALGINNLPRTKAESKLRRKQICREKDLRRAEAPRGTAFFGRTTFLRRRSSRWVQILSTYL
jgi:hypothetical protein